MSRLRPGAGRATHDKRTFSSEDFSSLEAFSSSELSSSSAVFFFSTFVFDDFDLRPATHGHMRCQLLSEDKLTGACRGCVRRIYITCRLVMEGTPVTVSP